MNKVQRWRPNPERLFIVAFIAIQSELIVVDILMTRVTCYIFNGCKFFMLTRWPGSVVMTWCAINGLVSTCQREAGYIVIKPWFFDIMKRGLTMTWFAIRTEWPIVGIFMAGITIFKRHVGKILKFFTVFSFHLMTWYTWDLGVGSVQWKFWLVMVK